MRKKRLFIIIACCLLAACSSSRQQRHVSNNSSICNTSYILELTGPGFPGYIHQYNISSDSIFVYKESGDYYSCVSHGHIFNEGGSLFIQSYIQNTDDFMIHTLRTTSNHIEIVLDSSFNTRIVEWYLQTKDGMTKFVDNVVSIQDTNFPFDVRVLGILKK